MADADIGDVRTLSATFRNAAGTGTNPTTVVLTIRKPDGTVVTPTPAATGAGVYNYVQIIDQAGVWAWKYTGTGTVTDMQQGQFSVRKDRTL